VIRVRQRPLVGVLISLALVTILGAAAVEGKGKDPPDLKVAVFVAGSCGTFGDSLPVLVTSTDLRPGGIAGDLVVCLKVVADDGRQPALTVDELVDLDVSCTGNEGATDRSCGGMDRGELAASLVQQVGVAPCSATSPAITPALERRLPALRDKAVPLMNRIRQGDLVCVRLRLVYQPTGPAAEVVSQSDRVTWRYAFSVTSD
jgi:hypothetical protein